MFYLDVWILISYSLYFPLQGIVRDQREWEAHGAKMEGVGLIDLSGANNSPLVPTI